MIRLSRADIAGTVLAAVLTVVLTVSLSIPERLIGWQVHNWLAAVGSSAPVTGIFLLLLLLGASGAVLAAALAAVATWSLFPSASRSRVCAGALGCLLVYGIFAVLLGPYFPSGTSSNLALAVVLPSWQGGFLIGIGQAARSGYWRGSGRIAAGVSVPLVLGALVIPSYRADVPSVTSVSLPATSSEAGLTGWCTAYASGIGHVGSGFGSSKATAERRALDQCGASDCRLVKSGCE